MLEVICKYFLNKIQLYIYTYIYVHIVRKAAPITQVKTKFEGRCCEIEHHNFDEKWYIKVTTILWLYGYTEIPLVLLYSIIDTSSIKCGQCMYLSASNRHLNFSNTSVNFKKSLINSLSDQAIKLVHPEIRRIYPKLDQF